MNTFKTLTTMSCRQLNATAWCATPIGCSPSACCPCRHPDERGSGGAPWLCERNQEAAGGKSIELDFRRARSSIRAEKSSAATLPPARSAATAGLGPIEGVGLGAAGLVDELGGVSAAIEKLLKTHEGVSITKILSRVDQTRAGFIATWHTLLEGMLLAAVVVFIFLRDWRSTLITAIATPKVAVVMIALPMNWATSCLVPPP